MNIRELAKKAGVSIATVSNVLHQKGKVSSQNRERILALIQEAGYSPRPRRSTKSKPKTLGIAIPMGFVPHHWETFLGDNPYYNELIAGIEECANKLGYDALLSVFGSDEELEAWLSEKHIGGVIFLGRHPIEAFQELHRLAEMPVVMLDAYGELRERFSNVGIDDLQGAYLATRHLLELGHRKIAYAECIFHPLEQQQSRDVQHQRQQGYKKALEDFGVPFRKELVFGDRLTLEGGYRIGKKIASQPLNPTAVFTTADILAIGMYRAFFEKSKRVPQDISIVGFDNINLSAFLTPGLTTVEQNMREKGTAAAQLLIDQIEEGERYVRRIELPVRLIIRESTARQ